MNSNCLNRTSADYIVSSSYVESRTVRILTTMAISMAQYKQSQMHIGKWQKFYYSCYQSQLLVWFFFCCLTLFKVKRNHLNAFIRSRTVAELAYKCIRLLNICKMELMSIWLYFCSCGWPQIQNIIHLFCSFQREKRKKKK